MNQRPDGLIGTRDPDDPRTLIIQRGPRRRKSLVMWSGGLDSTWTLVKMLRDSDDDVYAHHVHKRSRTDDGKQVSNLFQAESAAIKAMRAHLAAHYRPFAFSESAVDLTAFSTFARDNTTALFFTLQAAMTWGFQQTDQILTGANGDTDDDDANYSSDVTRYRTQYRRLLWHNLAQAVMQTERVPDMTWLMPAPKRQEEADLIGPDLFRMVVYCRHPVVEGEAFLPCGDCVTCKAMAKVRPPTGDEQPADENKDKESTL